MIDSTPICISYTYNNADLLSAVTYPDEDSIEYTPEYISRYLIDIGPHSPLLFSYRLLTT